MTLISKNMYIYKFGDIGTWWQNATMHIIELSKRNLLM